MASFPLLTIKSGDIRQDSGSRYSAYIDPNPSFHWILHDIAMKSQAQTGTKIKVFQVKIQENSSPRTVSRFCTRFDKDTALSVCYYMPNDVTLADRSQSFFQQAKWIAPEKSISSYFPFGPYVKLSVWLEKKWVQKKKKKKTIGGNV